MKKVIKVKCVNCGKDFLKLEKKKMSGRGMRDSKVRPSHALTCSHKCSVEYGKARKKSDEIKAYHKKYNKKRKEMK